MKIALYTHSTNPRGGVVHTLELGHALALAGHDVTIHAPDPTGAGFFRQTAARHISIPCAPAPKNLHAMMPQRIAEISAHIRAHGTHFDIHHAQDSINANALADCAASGVIKNFIRTVHHVDAFTDPQIAAWQNRGILAASQLFCVSETWQQYLRRTYNIHADIVPNGVSLERFSPSPTLRDIALRTELRLGSGPIFLAIGGIEYRKNTINILHAFERVRAFHPAAQLIIAGGASLLDHDSYQQQFHAVLAASPAAGHIILTGPVADSDMPSLYRLADALIFPSVKEGFGLVALEALASETPVVVSHIAPFIEYLSEHDCTFCDPHDPDSIASAMLQSLTPQSRAGAIAARQTVAGAKNWQASAARHLALYETAKNPEFAHA
jgi:glycosyltransferase-like protein